MVDQAPLSPSYFFHLAAVFFNLSLSLSQCWPGQRFRQKETGRKIKQRRGNRGLYSFCLRMVEIVLEVW